ncbi:MAG: hypothetical protein R8L53_02325 [Mariprofundales bacterium]
MNHIYSFALSPSMKSFLYARDACNCLALAEEAGNLMSWLLAAADLRSCLLGQNGKIPMEAEIGKVLADIERQLRKLSNQPKLEKYREQIQKNQQLLIGYRDNQTSILTDIRKFLATDVLIDDFSASLECGDWLGHRRQLPQRLNYSRQEDEQRMRKLTELLQPLKNALNLIDNILHNSVGWDQRTAHSGYDQYVPRRQDTSPILLIISFDKAGVVPRVLGNRFALKIQFQTWPAGKPAENVSEDIPYSMMLVGF